MSRYYCFGTINLSATTDKPAITTFYIDGVGTVPALFDTTTLPNGEYTVRAMSSTKNGLNTFGNQAIDRRLKIDFTTTEDYVIYAGRDDGYYINPPLNDKIVIGNNQAHFDGTEFFINNYPPLDLYIDDEFTLTVAVNPDSITTEQTNGLRSVVLYKGSAGGVNINYGIQLNNATTVQFFTRIAGNVLAFYSFTVPNMLGKWSHIAMSVKGTTLKCYVDEVLIGTQTLTGYVSTVSGTTEYINNDATTGRLCIGGMLEFDAITNFVGSLTDIGIYGKELTPSDIFIAKNRLKEWQSKKKIYIENIPNHNSTGGTPQMLRGVNTIQRCPINSESRAIMSSWGVKLQRIQLDIIRVANKTFEQSWPEALSYALQEVIACQALGIKCIVDIHSSPMATWSFTRAQMDDPLWMNRMTTIYQDVCSTFAPYSDTIWAYELYNEPFEPVLGYWRKYAAQFISIIRAIDQNVWLIYHEAPPSYRRFIQLEPLQDKRIIYSVHFYSPGDFIFQGLGRPTPIEYPATIKSIPLDKKYVYACLDLVKKFQDKYNVPIFVGEFSVVRYAPHDSSMRWFTDVLDYFEERQWSYCYHAFTYLCDAMFDLMQDVADPPLPGFVSVTGTPRTTDSDQLTLLKSYFARGL